MRVSPWVDESVRGLLLVGSASQVFSRTDRIMPHRWIDETQTVYASSEGWSINPAPGWSVEERVEDTHGERQPHVVIESPRGDASVRFDTHAPERLPAPEWIEMVAQSDRAKGRRVGRVRCGVFTGYEISFSSGDEWFRAWVLRTGPFPLGAVYRCPVSEAGRDDSVLEAMLGSLFFRRLPV